MKKAEKTDDVTGRLKSVAVLRYIKYRYVEFINILQKQCTDKAWRAQLEETRFLAEKLIGPFSGPNKSLADS